MHVYFISNRVYICLHQHRHHSRLFKQCLNTFQIGWNTVGTPFRLVRTLFKHFSDWFKHCSNTFQIGWNSVQTLLRLVGTVFKHFSDWLEQCSNTYYYGTGIRLIRTGEIHNYTCRQHVYFISHSLYIQQHVYLIFHRVYIFLSIWKYPYPSQTPFSWNLAKPHAKVLHLPRLISRESRK